MNSFLKEVFAIDWMNVCAKFFLALANEFIAYHQKNLDSSEIKIFKILDKFYSPPWLCDYILCKRSIFRLNVVY